MLKNRRVAQPPIFLSLHLITALLLAYLVFIPAVFAQPQLQPDVGNVISQYVVSANSARRAALRNAGLVSNIISSFPKARAYLVINDPAAFKFKHGENPLDVRVIQVPFENAITIWPQDPFLVLNNKESDEGRTILLMSRSFARADDESMARQLAKQGDFLLKRSKLYFEGGNIVSDKERIFIGANTISYNARKLGITQSSVVKRFEAELGRQVLVIGPFPQPIAHIDMILTPLRGKRVAVADAAVGADIIETLLGSGKGDIEAFESNTEAQFFGDASIRQVKGARGEIVKAPKLLGKSKIQAEKSRELSTYLDGLASSLREHGYQVLRTPFVDGGPILDGNEKPEYRAAYPMLTYNNVLVETDGEQDRVYIPSYGLDALDRAAKQSWQGAGFDVIQIPGFVSSAMYGGALRCAFKVLRRQSPNQQ